MRTLLTGAAGHLGRHVAPLLAKDGFEVVGFDMAPTPTTQIPGLHTYIHGDLSDETAVAEALHEVELVVHCASLHPWKSYSDTQYIDANIKGTWSLYHAIAGAGIEKVVQTSSIATIGCNSLPVDRWPIDETYTCDPSDMYSFTKYTQETTARLFAAQHGVQTIALRPPAFMPLNEMQTGFQLPGCFSVASDMARILSTWNGRLIVGARLRRGQNLAEFSEPRLRSQPPAVRCPK